MQRGVITFSDLELAHAFAAVVNAQPPISPHLLTKLTPTSASPVTQIEFNLDEVEQLLDTLPAPQELTQPELQTFRSKLQEFVTRVAIA